MSQVYAWLGQSESDRLEDETIAAYRSSGSTRRSGRPSPPASVEAPSWLITVLLAVITALAIALSIARGTA